jgi:hypothetical protein
VRLGEELTVGELERESGEGIFETLRAIRGMHIVRNLDMNLSISLVEKRVS